MAFAQAKPPANVYEQLCKVNPEWHKHRLIAQQLGLLNTPIIEAEQDLLAFHIQTLHKIFSKRTVNDLSATQQRNREKHLAVLNQYWQLRDCPRNYYLSYHNPVFIDHEGRYCAVGYLMLKSGKQEFCKAVQKNSNFIKIREIQSTEFTQWQTNSGLSLNELAWIQPYYSPQTRYEEINTIGTARTPRFLDSLQTFYLNRPSDYYLYNHQFSRMFMGERLLNIQKALRKSRYWGKPDWKALEKQQMSILHLTQYGAQLYVIARGQYAEDLGKTQFAIFKWNKQGKWERFNTEFPVYVFFTHKGKLYAGGGYETHIKTTEDGMAVEKPEYTHSYLLRLDRKNWNKIDQEYGGIVFGMYRRGNKSYLATVVNTSLGGKRAPILSKAKPNK
ncbi:hypothetical protein BKI52_00360 [marine bacterium AO1-C]|nr:hypothetical protein BKI52_00360 [marine bacterium AO1-C]